VDKRVKDMTGMRFGRLVVVSFSHTTNLGTACWNVICDCGNNTVVRGDNLRRGTTRSCGCIRKINEYKRPRKKELVRRKIIEMSGKRFGRWLVISRADDSKDGKDRWNCICECGTTRDVLGKSLRSGDSKSCGCLSIELTIQRNKCRSGSLNPNWNENLTDEKRHANRDYAEYIEWRTSVYKRDVYTCQKCGGNAGGDLNAHHIESYNSNKELRTSLGNGVTLCEECHHKFHRIYGQGHNTREQFNEFMEDKECEEWRLAGFGG